MLRGRIRLLSAILTATAAAIGVAACGSSASGGSGSGSAATSTDSSTLLKQTFSSGSTVRSGKLSFRIVITPTGSSIITAPITLTVSGPFVQAERGKLPESDFTIAFNGVGKHASFGVLSTRKAAYISLQGTSYKLPAADFKQINRDVSRGSSTGTLPGLSSLGINPEKWLSNPQVVGTEQVNGAQTEHLSATLDVVRVLDDFNTLLTKDASKLNVPAGTEHISPATVRKIAAAIKNPTVDVWTGRSDRILRRMQIGATVPVSGSTSTQLGGLTSAAFKITIDASDINQPQTITAPSSTQSYRALQTKLQSILQGLGGLGSLGSTGSSSAGSGTATAPAAGSAKQLKKYSNCINGARGDVTKMQKCASLLNGSGG